MTTTPPKSLARILELEYPCERCHERPAVVIYDCASVCARCHAALDRGLTIEAKRVS